jgi:hypothetical protein
MTKKAKTAPYYLLLYAGTDFVGKAIACPSKSIDPALRFWNVEAKRLFGKHAKWVPDQSLFGGYWANERTGDVLSLR